MKVSEIKAKLDELGIEYEETLLKPELEALLPEDARGTPEETSITLSARFVAIQEDGTKVWLEYSSKEDSVKELLENVVDRDGNPYPKGINALVIVRVQKGDRDIERSIAPHKARQILENKEEEVFNAVFR